MAPATTILLPGDTPLSIMQVEGGTYHLGKTKGEHGHEVRVADFAIGQYPITNGQFAVFLQDYNSDTVKTGTFAGQSLIRVHRWGLQQNEGSWVAAKGFEEHPVISVSWHGANAFCHWLSEYTGDKYSLPAEAQWEYAARGGKYSRGFAYAGSNKLKEVGWYARNSHWKTKPVGLKQPNELGIFDMSGNVREWCQDHWHRNRKQIPQDGSPWLDAEKAADPEARLVVRGGSWNYFDPYCRVSLRDGFNAALRDFDIGFRVVRY